MDAIFEKRELEIKENCNVTRLARVQKKFLAKRIRAHDGCLGIRRLRRTRKTAIILGELSTSIDPGVSEWGNPSSVIG